ncbi:MAG: flagellar protein FliS [Desulfovibrionaceae bacterium]
MNRIDTYKKNTMANKDGFDMFLEVLEAVERGIKKGKKAIVEKDYLEQGRALVLCTEILLELEERLPIAENTEALRTSMIRLFDYTRENIIRGNQDQDLASLDNALNTISEMRTVTEKIKEHPEFNQIKREAHRNERSSAHSIARFTMQHSTVEESAEDMLIFLSGYQSMQETQERYAEKNVDQK